MRLKRLFAIAMVALGVGVAAPAAHAVTFTFADPGALTPGSFAACFSAGDRCGTSLTFTAAGIRVTATSTGTPPLGGANAVIQDLNPDRGGLGVVYRNSGGAWVDGGLGDEVNPGETLILSFSDLGGNPLSVVLSGATFYDPDHNAIGATRTFNFKIDAGGYASHTFGGAFADTGTTFYFQRGGANPKDFYLASMTVDVAPIPEPGTLLLLGTGVLGFAGRFRRRAGC
jgi:hypothetical protein